MKKMSRKKRRIYAFVVASFGFMSGFVLIATLLTLSYFREANSDPSIFLSMGSVGVVVFSFCFWRLRKLEVIDDKEDTE